MSQVSIQEQKTTNFKSAGTGCPLGTVLATLSPDGGFLNLAFSNFSAQVYPGSDPRDAHKSCQFDFQLKKPKGWTVRFVDTTFKGNVDLSPKITASLTSTYYFGGRPEAKSTFRCPKRGWVGPIDQNYSCTDSLKSSVRSSCRTSESLVINAAIDIDNRKNRKGTGYLTTESIEVVQSYQCKWTKC